MSNKARRLADWIRAHPWLPTGFFAGALLGLVLALPIVPFELPESSATLIGAALGAFVAVWGAAWLSDGRERREKQRQIEITSVGAFQIMHDIESHVDVSREFCREQQELAMESPRAIFKMPNHIENCRVRANVVQAISIATLFDVPLGRRILSVANSVPIVNEQLDMVIADLRIGTTGEAAAEMFDMLAQGYENLGAAAGEVVEALASIGFDFDEQQYIRDNRRAGQVKHD